MSSRTWLVADREIRAIARLKSFWFMLISFPLLIALSAAAGTLLGDGEPERVMIVDRSGGAVGAALARRFDVEHQRAIMRELATYAKRHGVAAKAKGRVWENSGSWFDDQAVARFEAEGGLATAERELARIRPADAAPFEAPAADFEIKLAPPATARGDDAAVAKIAVHATDGQEGSDKFDLVIDIPPGFGPDPRVRMWSAETPRISVINFIETELTQALRTRLLTGAGVNAQLANAATNIAPTLQITTPRDGEGRDGVLIRSAAPAFAVYLLIMAIFISGGWMLQGTVEERSDKLIESVIACLTPDELLHGKLIGAVVVTMFVVVAWLVCAGASVPFMPAEIVEAIKVALDPLGSVVNVVAILYFFAAGYLVASMLFLAVGALSNSMQESQAYLTPVMLLLLLPVSFILQPAFLDSGGPMLQIMQWIPLYTPFVMLVRLGNGVPVWELIAAAALVTAFLALEFVAIGRLFRAALLRTGQPPRLVELVRMIRSG